MTASPTTRIALFGGIYSNYLALEAAVADVQRIGVDSIYCLGDLGAFGPHPDRVFPLLDEHGVQCIRGNYDDSIGRDLADCQCGYTDPRDNHFAQLSYDYTLANTSPANRAWLTSERSIRSLVERRIDHDTRIVAASSVSAETMSEVRKSRLRNVTAGRSACSRTA